MAAKDVRDLILLCVPAVIALAMVAAAIYLAIWTEKVVPAFLVTSLSTILGYYFGIGVGSGINSDPADKSNSAGRE